MNIVITGASKGFGKALAEQFAAGGHQLFLCSRSETGLYQAAEDLLNRFPHAIIKARPADLSDNSQLTDWANWVLGYGVPDILINNAGRFIPGSVHNEAPGALEEMLAVNLFSAYHLTRLFLPAMMERKTGHIFNICSIASLQAYSNGGSYSISKYALLGFSRNLREEMKPYGIKVTSVMPGAAYTASWEGAGIDPGRIMTATDIAIMVEAASRLSPQACVEDIILRPQLGDL
ncbi:SDR family NAD(P)-dependent oxidoreductase [Flavihumibacter stibioxidans]|uniref:Short-chain dehydrogenase n=1 Tax=Flavihumibacter stibioxidans TaxID=1834163 RepID=A0ABR7M851_9BACT|nr:SDR family NAD(P)-dependent oxidoreductase [Flavihumibacter stibioxidans]MBC6491132.1 short-chain dehydrogenase [Flavihumibacter stibioxidans]